MSSPPDNTTRFRWSPLGTGHAGKPPDADVTHAATWRDATSGQYWRVSRWSDGSVTVGEVTYRDAGAVPVCGPTVTLDLPPAVDLRSVLPLHEWISRGETRVVGPIAPYLIDGWWVRGEGGSCPRCGTKIEEYVYMGCACPACLREYQEVKGCRCGGSNLCSDCRAAGATEWTRGEVRCTPDCSTLCPICSPDD